MTLNLAALAKAGERHLTTEQARLLGLDTTEVVDRTCRKRCTGHSLHALGAAVCDYKANGAPRASQFSRTGSGFKRGMFG